MLGAGRVIAIDRLTARLRLAEEFGGAEIINYETSKDVLEEIKDRTGGKGPDAVIDAVGMEAHGSGLMGFYDRTKQTVRLETDRPTALIEKGEINPAMVITHRLKLDDAPQGYKMFRDKEDNCIKVVLKPCKP